MNPAPFYCSHRICPTASTPSTPVFRTESGIVYQIIRSNRKTIAIQIAAGGAVLVRCPWQMGTDAIRAFVEEKAGWIRKHLEKQAAAPKLAKITETELQRLAQEALHAVPERAAHFAPLIGVQYGRITIRCQRSRWGSCSSQGNLNFNCLLMLAPPEVLDYVVVHELCHRKEMNHSQRFWAEVARILPDYRDRRNWLKEHGNELIRRFDD